MKRTIKLRVDVADEKEYADLIERLVFQNPQVTDGRWTATSRYIQAHLRAKGHEPFWAKTMKWSANV